MPSYRPCVGVVPDRPFAPEVRMPRLSLTWLALVILSIPLQAVDRKDLKSGLLTQYTEATEEAPPRTHTRLEPTVALTLNAGQSPHPQLAGVKTIRWAGYMTIVTPGEYRFTSILRNGSLTVRLGETAVFQGAGKVDAPAVVTGEPNKLEPGVQPFEATFTTERSGGPVQIELQWEGPGFVREPIPNVFFGHLPKDRGEDFLQSAQQERGRFLFEELSCVKCHQPTRDHAMAKTLAERTGPHLSDVGARVYPGWLYAWLGDPQKLRPHTQMPKMFTEDATGDAERYAVVQFLTSLRGPLEPPGRGPFASNDYRRSVSRGETLFVTTGCATCHGKQLSGTPKKNEDEEEDELPAPKFDPYDALHGLGSATGSQALYTLGAVGSKTRFEVLAKYLEDPLKTNPHGRMPKMQLSGGDAQDLARHLCRITDDAIERDKVPTPKAKPADLAKTWLDADAQETFGKLKPADQWTTLGKSIIVGKGCVNCHTLEVQGKALPTLTTAKDKLPPLEAIPQAAPGQGCLAEKPAVGKVPAYPLTEQDRAALQAFITQGLAGAGSQSPVHAGRVALRRYLCLNCHQRDSEGGIGLELADQMKGLENAENADDVQPPRLTGIGHKARTDWLRSVLTQGGRARPWMTLRMPQYGTHKVGFLPEALAAIEGTTPDTEAPKATFTADLIQNGRLLAGKNGHGCISCHDISGITGGGTRGPDLALTNQRVRFDWYARWMHNPQRIVPGTRMPQNFIDGKALLATVYGGDGDKHIAALWAYMALGPGLPLPAGMEPPKGLIIAVKDRPEVLRTFMPENGGTRAIAVGFPAGVSYSFDAQSCQLTYAWEGNFLDASPVWNNRGGAPAKLLGPKFYQPPEGHPWGITTSRQPPDFASRAKDYAWGAPLPQNVIHQGPMHVQFEGYRLDTAGIPTFRYRVRTGEKDSPELQVADTPSPLKASVASGLSRAIVLTQPAQTTAWFLGGTTAGSPRAYAPGGTPLAVDLQAQEPEVPAIGSHVVLPLPGTRALVLHLTAGKPGTVWRFVRSENQWQAVLRVPEPAKEERTELQLNTWILPRDDEGLLKALTSEK